MKAGVDARDGQEEGEMPKEIVHCTLETVQHEANGEPVDQVRYREVAVNWSKQDLSGNGDVFVGVLGEGGMGTHGRLTRAEINRLIRSLRRARDGAYGADA